MRENQEIDTPTYLSNPHAVAEELSKQLVCSPASPEWLAKIYQFISVDETRREVESRPQVARELD